MHTFDVNKLIEPLAQRLIAINTQVAGDLRDAMERALPVEASPIGKAILEDLLKNQDIADSGHIPICQDTGLVIIFAEVGQDLHLVGGDFESALQKGVAKGYQEGFLRKSVVGDPLERKNTGDNTPAVVYTRIVPGDRLTLHIMAKGFGSENMSRLAMLKPSDGEKGVVDFVLKTVSDAGPNPCPPIVVGVGIGGTFDKAAALAKEALLRPLEDHHPQIRYAKLEKLLLEQINRLGIGPQGLGGTTTCLGVKVAAHPTHIAGLPVAVNIGCHAHRHSTLVF